MMLLDFLFKSQNYRLHAPFRPTVSIYRFTPPFLYSRERVSEVALHECIFGTEYSCHEGRVRKQDEYRKEG